MKRTVLVLFLVVLAGCAINRKQRVVVFDGRGTEVTRATIVLAEKPTKSARLAAAELQYHIELITGHRMPVENEPAEVSGTRILVGASESTEKLGLPGRPFGRQEYLIRFYPDTVVLMGRDKEDYGDMDYTTGSGLPDIFDEIGTLYAAYDFLERYCGVRWYLPTDLGTTYTPSEKIIVSGSDIRRSPAMEYRFVHMGYRFPIDLVGDTVPVEKPADVLPVREHLLFYLRNRIGGSAHAVNHSFYGWYKRFWNPDKIEDHRPELFAQGYPETKIPPQLCYTSPDVVAQVVQDARDYFDGKGLKTGAVAAGDHFALEPMDNNSWCRCKNCQKWLLEEATLGKGQFSNNRASDYHFQFVNRVAKEVKKTHPDKFISTLAYSQHCYPPEKVRLESNIDVTLCLHARAWGYSPTIKENDLKILNSWVKREEKPGIYLWLYYCFPSLSATQGGYRMFPGFFAPDIVKQMKIFHEAGVRGIKYEPSYVAGRTGATGVSRQSPLFDQLEFYVTWKLADNPEIDGDALIEEFFTRYYGPAAKPMRDFYMTAAEIFGNPENRKSGVSDPELSWKYLGTQERMKELGVFMEEARRMVAEKGTEKERERVALFNRGIWEYMQKGYSTYQKQARIPFPVVKVPKVLITEEEPSLIDWSAGAVMEGWCFIDGGPTDKKIEGRILHNGKRLYIRLVDRMNPVNLVDRNGSIWSSDNYEIFMAPQRGRPYHQIGIHFDGRFAPLIHPLGGSMKDWLFTGKIISDTSQKDRWILYLIVPFKDIGVKAGGVMYMNVIRSISINPQVAVMWNPTFGPYHATERFAEVTLLE